MKVFLLMIPILIGVAFTAFSQDLAIESLKYLNQESPGSVPKIFGPGLVSKNDELEFGSVFSKDGTEFFYAVTKENKAEIIYMKLENNQWTPAEPLLYSEIYGYNDPYLSPDENRLYFISDMPLDGKGAKKDIDIWYIERTEGGWTEPLNAGKVINSEKNEYYISITQEGTMYFSSNANTNEENNHNYDIYASTVVNGEFQHPVKLSDAINTEGYEADVFIAYDESYMIFCSERHGGLGRGDLYISFNDEAGHWTKAKNMGNRINTEGYEFCPFVTNDGKYFFYTSNMDIYWVDAGIINDFR